MQVAHIEKDHRKGGFFRQNKRVCVIAEIQRICQTPCGGELGIRTPDSFHYASFQDWCIQPLYQLSIFSYFVLRQCIVYVKLG